MTLPMLQELNTRGKRVLVRVDFNVPMHNGKITDDTRIKATIPTINYLREQNAKIILCSHLGRPGGLIQEETRLGPIATYLSDLLKIPVGYATTCIGADVTHRISSLNPGDVLLLENLRFHAGEEANNLEFSKELASLAEIFVNDAFGAAHRAHASTAGIAKFLPSAAGLLLEKEVRMLGKILENPERPMSAVMGGAKISDKIPVLENLLEKLDRLLIGGGMAATFFKALGFQVGSSLIEEDLVGFVSSLIEKAKSLGILLILPEDVIVAREFEPDSPLQNVSFRDIPDNWCIMDIGLQSRRIFKENLLGSKTVLWNGTMGVFEFPRFAEGTRDIGIAISQLENGITIVGGGSTVEAVTTLGLADIMTHVSTGGGASLEFLEGRTLPGLAALSR